MTQGIAVEMWISVEVVNQEAAVIVIVSVETATIVNAATVVIVYLSAGIA